MTKTLKVVSLSLRCERFYYSAEVGYEDITVTTKSRIFIAITKLLPPKETLYFTNKIFDLISCSGDNTEKYGDRLSHAPFKCWHPTWSASYSRAYRDVGCVQSFLTSAQWRYYLLCWAVFAWRVVLCMVSDSTRSSVQAFQVQWMHLYHWAVTLHDE